MVAVVSLTGSRTVHTPESATRAKDIPGPMRISTSAPLSPLPGEGFAGAVMRIEAPGGVVLVRLA
jgi:hypothetical protein